MYVGTQMSSVSIEFHGVISSAHARSMLIRCTVLPIYHIIYLFTSYLFTFVYFLFICLADVSINGMFTSDEL